MYDTCTLASARAVRTGRWITWIPPRQGAVVLHPDPTPRRARNSSTAKRACSSPTPRRNNNKERDEEEREDGETMIRLIQLEIRRRRVDEKASTCRRTSCCMMHGCPLALILSMAWSKRAQPFGTTFIYGFLNISISRPTPTRSSTSVNENPTTINGTPSKKPCPSIAGT